MSWAHPNRRGLPAEWPKLVAQVKHRAGGRCETCGGRGASVDHITPRFEGGTDDLSNLQLLCWAHHQRKTSQEAARGRRRRPDLLPVRRRAGSIRHTEHEED